MTFLCDHIHLLIGMNARERMIKALERSGEPDRVPIFIEGMMADFIKKTDQVYGDLITDEMILMINHDWTWSKFYGFDSQWLHSSPVQMKELRGIDTRQIRTKDPEEYVNRWGHVSKRGVYQSGYLNTKELWQEWIDAGYFEYQVDQKWIRSWEKSYPEMIKQDLIPVPVDVNYEKIREAFDFGKFSYFLRKERPFMQMLADKIFEVQMEFAKGVCDAGFDIITFADDCAYKGNVMFSPQIFEELIVPGYTRLNNYIHKRGLLSFFHSDGYTLPFFPGLIKSGFDGIQSLEPAAGMDLKAIKEQYGDKVTLIGNLDCSRLLPFGTVEEVTKATKQCLSDAMKGGGYILGPTTDIIDSCRPENIKAMVDTCKKYGVYKK